MKVPKGLKWYLPEDKVPPLLARLRALASVEREFMYDCLAFFIRWTTRTGLRIEESLRLEWDRDLAEDLTWVRVPGLKTATSQATLPLGQEVSEVLVQWRGILGDNKKWVFPINYEELALAWTEARKFLGAEDDPTATLKALRRSAARYLHVDCGMPLHMVQQYLRHESMDTTLEYLRLTGGYGTEEMRRYLK